MNIFPPREWTSALFVGLHAVVLWSVWTLPAPAPKVRGLIFEIFKSWLVDRINFPFTKCFFYFFHSMQVAKTVIVARNQKDKAAIA